MLNRRLPNIIVPLDLDALNLAYGDEFELSEKYEYLPIERKEVSVFSMGIISELIYKSLHLEIDDYEMLYSTDLDCLQNLIDDLDLNKEKVRTIDRDYLEALSYLLSLAIKYKTGIFFRF